MALENAKKEVMSLAKALETATRSMGSHANNRHTKAFIEQREVRLAEAESEVSQRHLHHSDC